MMDVMSIKGEHLACFGPRCSDPFLSSWFTPLIPVKLAILMIVNRTAP